MQSFAYTALEPTGKKRTGFLDAADQEAAIAQLSAQGTYVLEIKPQAATAVVRNTKKASRQEVALFTRRMADLAAAGLPLDRVLQVVAEQSESGQLIEISEQALADVRTGLPISAALAKYPKVFPLQYTETLRAGEASGQFPEVATRLADLQETEVARRSQISSALIYPTILLIAAIGVVFFLILFVVPRMIGIFKDLGNDLPLSTKILLSTADFLTKNGLVAFGALVAIVLILRGWFATEAGAISRDRFLMRAPIIGKVVGKAVVSRYARILGTLLFGGVPILEALRLSGLASGNRLFQVTSEQVANDVREGKRIHQAMRDSNEFPPVLHHMVAIGEETGDLPAVLNRVATSLDFEVEVGLRNLVAKIEPLILVLMGAFVGFVVLSIALPIFQAQNLVK
ncbi:MAG: type II secretion system F family protein [Chthonomonas sp.]|nr:type II secretion system F family protein [Chthonomonas sp.]